MFKELSNILDAKFLKINISQFITQGQRNQRVPMHVPILLCTCSYTALRADAAGLKGTPPAQFAEHLPPLLFSSIYSISISSIFT